MSSNSSRRPESQFQASLPSLLGRPVPPSHGAPSRLASGLNCTCWARSGIGRHPLGTKRMSDWPHPLRSASTRFPICTRRPRPHQPFTGSRPRALFSMKPMPCGPFLAPGGQARVCGVLRKRPPSKQGGKKFCAKPWRTKWAVPRHGKDVPPSRTFFGPRIEPSNRWGGHPSLHVHKQREHTED